MRHEDLCALAKAPGHPSAARWRGRLRGACRCAGREHEARIVPALAGAGPIGALALGVGGKRRQRRGRHRRLPALHRRRSRRLRRLGRSGGHREGCGQLNEQRRSPARTREEEGAPGGRLRRRRRLAAAARQPHGFVGPADDLLLLLRHAGHFSCSPVVGRTLRVHLLVPREDVLGHVTLGAPGLPLLVPVGRPHAQRPAIGIDAHLVQVARPVELVRSQPVGNLQRSVGAWYPQHRDVEVDADRLVRRRTQW
mmetsp:Transcript_34847/g.112380  ORF Transcript_34847/g.112380 Transcript_34847/m.112380 type:complete len:253 (-) Transcript_34847:202-960(-)